MKIRLKNIFNNVAKKIKKPLIALMAIFMIFANPSSLGAKNIQEQRVHELSSQTTYWKNDQTTAVAKIWPCKEKGLCLTVVDLDPQSTGAQTLYKDVKTYLDIDELSIKNKNNNKTGVMEICGRSFRKKFEQNRKGNWSRGNMFKSFYMNIEKNGHLKIGGRVLIFSVSKDFRKVDKPAETCMQRMQRQSIQSQKIASNQP